MSKKILCGFDDLYELPGREHLVGAGGGAATVKGAKSSSAKKWSKTSIDKPKARKLHPAHNLAPLAASAKKVKAVVNRALATLKYHPSTPAGRAAVAIRGLVALVGAIQKAPPIKKPITPKQQAAVAKATAAAKKASAAAGDLKRATIKALTAGKAANALARQVKSQYKRTAVRGDLIGADPDPFNPGFLTDGSPDPNYDWSTVDASDTYDPSLDAVQEVPIAAAPPLQTPINFPVPADGIRYDGPIAPYDVGSYWYWYGPQSTKQGPQGEMGITGFCWGWNHANWPGSDSLKNPQWVWLTGQDSITHDQKWNVAPSPITNDHVSDLSINGYASQGLDLGPGVNVFGPPWGPLVGNPFRANTKNLRWSIPDKCWFWFLEEAPESVLAPIKYQAAKAAQLAAEAERAANEAAAKQAAKDAADQAAAQAAQDAANALAESAAASQYNVAETQAAAQDLQLQQQQAQFDLEAQRQEMEMQRQQAQLEMQRQQMELQLLQQAAQAEAQAQPAPQQYALPPPAAPPTEEYFDEGDGAVDPEGASELEAEMIEEGTDVIGADGQAVRVDGYGNAE